MDKKTHTAPPQPFVQRGYLLAIPLTFAGVTPPLPAHDSYIARVAAHPNGSAVLGGTDGDQTHLFLAAPKAPHGYVIDLGTPWQAHQTRGLFTVEHDLSSDASSHNRLFRTGYVALAAVNAADHGMVVMLPVPHLPEGIQEWGFHPPPIHLLHQFDHEKILDACAIPGRAAGLVLTEHRLVTVGVDGEVSLVPGGDELAGTPGLIPDRCADTVYCFSTDGGLMRIDPHSGHLHPTDAALPHGEPPAVATAYAQGHVCACDMNARLYGLNADSGSANQWPAAPPLTPVQTLAFLDHGRGFGVCGDGVGRMFELTEPGGRVLDLGVPAAVLGNKRYGFRFGPAMSGRDGELFLGEYDRGGHLWIYLPRG